VEITLAQLTSQLHGNLLGGDGTTVVTGVAGIESVSEGEVTFVMHSGLLSTAEASPALAIIAPPDITCSAKPLLIVDDPRSAFAQTMRCFDWRVKPSAGIDTTARVAASAVVHDRAYLGPYVVVGEGAVIGADCTLHPHAVIGDHVELGAGSVIYPHVTIYPRCTIGCRVIIHAGVSIGADGHGYQPSSVGWQKIPHLGTVVIEDDVEIGANTTIDRATSGKTVIGRGTKIDNLVMIAHNVQIGADCMILGQAGISGSCRIDDHAIIAGQAGLRDHVHIGAHATIVGQAGITKDVPAGMTVSGYPAQNHREELKFEAALRRVPSLLDAVKQLKLQIAELEARVNKEK